MKRKAPADVRVPIPSHHLPAADAGFWLGHGARWVKDMVKKGELVGHKHSQNDITVTVESIRAYEERTRISPDEGARLLIWITEMGLKLEEVPDLRALEQIRLGLERTRDKVEEVMRSRGAGQRVAALQLKEEMA